MKNEFTQNETKLELYVFSSYEEPGSTHPPIRCEVVQYIKSSCVRL